MKYFSRRLFIMMIIPNRLRYFLFLSCSTLLHSSSTLQASLTVVCADEPVMISTLTSTACRDHFPSRSVFLPPQQAAVFFFLFFLFFPSFYHERYVPSPLPVTHSLHHDDFS